MPLLLVLAHAGMNPHWANLTTLVVLFGLRFWISDRFIWNSKRIVADMTGEPVVPPTPADVLIEMKRDELGPHMALNLRPGRRTKRHYYNIHGIVSIASEVELPELAYFTVAPFTRRADVTVRRGYVGDRRLINRVTAIKGPGSFVYREHLGSMGVNFRVDLNDRIVVTVSPLLARSKHVVYTNVVEALNRFVLVNKGYMLLHSATVQLGDQTVMLSAQTDTGKTGTILRLLQEHPEGTAFLSDDMTIINRTGDAWSFPKPLTISSHTLRAVNTRVLSLPRRVLLAVQSRVHSKQGREFALLLARLNIPIIAINAVTQILVPPPKYMIDKLVPTVTYSDHGKVDRIFIIGRGDRSRSRCPMTRRWPPCSPTPRTPTRSRPSRSWSVPSPCGRRTCTRARSRTSSSCACASVPSSTASSAPRRSPAWCRPTSAGRTSSPSASASCPTV